MHYIIVLLKKITQLAIGLILFLNLIGKDSAAQIVGQYTGVDFATNYTNPVQGSSCGNISGINASIGDADFVNGAAEVPLGWQFSGTWNSGLTYYDGPGSEVLLVSLHTYTESWHVALRLSNSTTTAFQPFNLTIITTNATGSLNHCGGVVNNFNYERPSQELDFANYAIPAGVGVIGIIFEPFADGAVDPDPHGVLILQGTLSGIPCDTVITTNQNICQGDSVLFQGTYYNSSGIFSDSLINFAGCDSVLLLNLTVNPSFLNNLNQSICNGDSILLEGSFQTTTGIYTDSLQTTSGCDSIVITNLTINPTYQISQNLEICQGDSILIGGTFYNSSGNYPNLLQSNLGCDSLVTTLLTVTQFGDATISLVDSLCENNSSIFLTAVTNGGIWSGVGIINSSSGQFDPNIAGAGQHEIIYNLGSLCQSADTTIILVLPSCNLIIPNVITPNGDGLNDFLVFKNLESFPNNHLLIFNRWGQNLFETDNYQNNWNGDGHSDGTYFFILELNNPDNTIHKGAFTIFE